MSLTRALVAVGLLAVGLVIGGDLASRAAGQQADNPPATRQPAAQRSPEAKALSDFMRVKLEASGKVLEGLAVENYELIKEGAAQLNRMSTAEKWRVINDPLYRQFSGDFQRITQELVDAAEDENLDKSALKWVDATMSCIECHRFARGIMITQDRQ